MAAQTHKLLMGSLTLFPFPTSFMLWLVVSRNCTSNKVLDHKFCFRLCSLELSVRHSLNGKYHLTFSSPKWKNCFMVLHSTHWFQKVNNLIIYLFDLHNENFFLLNSMKTRKQEHKIIVYLTYSYSDHIYSNDTNSNALDTLVGVYDLVRTEEMYIHIRQDKTILHEVIIKQLNIEFWNISYNYCRD